MGKGTFKDWLAVLAFIGAIIANAVTAGMNWQKFIQQQRDLEALQKFQQETLPATYVPRELYALDRQSLRESIERLASTLDRLNDPPRHRTDSLQPAFDK